MRGILPKLYSELANAQQLYAVAQHTSCDTSRDGSSAALASAARTHLRAVASLLALEPCSETRSSRWAKCLCELEASLEQGAASKTQTVAGSPTPWLQLLCAALEAHHPPVLSVLSLVRRG